MQRITPENRDNVKLHLEECGYANCFDDHHDDEPANKIKQLKKVLTLAVYKIFQGNVDVTKTNWVNFY